MPDTDEIAARLRDYLCDTAHVDPLEKTTAVEIGELRALLDERERLLAVVKRVRHLDIEHDVYPKPPYEHMPNCPACDIDAALAALEEKNDGE